jgi:hypothetical protein
LLMIRIEPIVSTDSVLRKLLKVLAKSQIFSKNREIERGGR